MCSSVPNQHLLGSSSQQHSFPQDSYPRKALEAIDQEEQIRGFRKFRTLCLFLDKTKTAMFRVILFGECGLHIIDGSLIERAGRHGRLQFQPLLGDPHERFGILSQALRILAPHFFNFFEQRQ